MATASKIQLSPSHRPVFAVPNLQQASADKASKLLQENHDRHHMYFNGGLHNHIVHHMLTIYALGASPEELQKGFDDNTAYQTPALPENELIIQNMHDESTFKKYLGQKEHYADYLRFFREEIDQKGWQDVCNTWLFARTETADDMLVRLFAGFLHPIIHLGFGIEFAQPAIIAEALAQAATHDTWIGKALLPAEKYAQAAANAGGKTLFELLDQAAASSTLVNSIRDSDGNKMREGVIARAGDEMAKLAAQFTVKPDDLDAKCAEMFDFSAFVALAAQRPDKEVRVDFFLMHDLNCSVFFPYLLSHPSMAWLSDENKARLLEWKARTDLIQWVSRGSPKLLSDEITGYTPKQTASSAATGWDGMFRRVNALDHDDGHSSKLIRALAAGEQACRQASLPHGAVKSDMWEKMAFMTIDSVESARHTSGEKWVRSCGLDSAWVNVPDRKRVANGASTL